MSNREFIIVRDLLRWGSWMMSEIKPDGITIPVAFVTTSHLLDIEPGLKKIIMNPDTKQFWAMEGPDK